MCFDQHFDNGTYEVYFFTSEKYRTLIHVVEFYNFWGDTENKLQEGISELRISRFLLTNMSTAAIDRPASTNIDIEELHPFPKKLFYLITDWVTDKLISRHKILSKLGCFHNFTDWKLTMEKIFTVIIDSKRMIQRKRKLRPIWACFLFINTGYCWCVLTFQSFQPRDKLKNLVRFSSTFSTFLMN